MDQYHTKSDITWSDVRPEFMGSMIVHFPQYGMKSATDRSNFFLLPSLQIKNIVNGHKLPRSRIIDHNLNYTPPWLNKPNKQPNHNPHLLCDSIH